MPDPGIEEADLKRNLLQANLNGVTIDYYIKNLLETPTWIFSKQLRRYDSLPYLNYEVSLEFVPNLSTTIPN